MRRLPLVLLLTLPLAAQGFAHNTFEFSNWWLADREDHFPNYATGNVAGDALFKVLPSAILERAGDHLISGYRIGLSVDDAFTGTFPQRIELPGVQLARTMAQTIGGRVFDVPDRTRTVGPEFDPIPIFLPTDDAWVVEVEFDPSQGNGKLRQLLSVPALVDGQRAGLAMLALAEPGARRDPAVAGVVLQSSFGERHFAPGADSHSGAYDARANTIAMFGTTGQPSATGELYLALRFANPTLQLTGTSAGGLVGDPQRFETRLGPGAYATDLASRRTAGALGFFVQAEQFDPAGAAPTHTALPLLVAISPGGPSATLAVGAARLRVAPGELGEAAFFVNAGMLGPLARHAAGGAVGFDEDQRGAFASRQPLIAPDPVFIGLALWIQALIVDHRSFASVDATNVVRLTLQ
jgi:hypothetical protein